MSRETGVTLTLKTGLLFLALGANLLGDAPVAAQTNDEVNAAIQFNFTNPGARSLALGGAFIGLADDATAAYANPSGLKVLSEPEFSVEGRQWNYTHVFTDSGDARNGLNNLANGTAENDVIGFSFISYVYPMKRWAIAFYRHEIANFEADFEAGFGETLFFDDGSLFRPTRTALDLEIISTGLSFSFELSEALALGIGVSYLDFSLDSLTERFDSTENQVVGDQTQFGNDTASTWNAGLLWDVNDRVTLGAVYRKGASFDLLATNSEAFEAVFRLPDTYGVGLALRPGDQMTFTLDYVRVEYSDLTDDFTDLFDTPDVDLYRLDDGDEVRLGFEYVFLAGGKPLPLRFGVWLDPDHSVRYDGQSSEGNAPADRALFRGGDDEVHYAFGFGRSFGQRFQVDAAFDLSDRIDTVSVSTIFRF